MAMFKKLVSMVLVFVLCLGLLSSTGLAARDYSEPQLKAEALSKLNILKGDGTSNFALDRAPTRGESLVMFIRLIGDESTVMAGGWAHSFKDVPEWLSRYAGYANLMGYAKGTSPTTFGSNDTAGALVFLTFVLRALGYSDEAGGDFTWSNPFDLARKIGLLTENVDTVNFKRGDIALVSWNALSLPMKGGNKALADLLIMGGVFTRSQYDEAAALVKKGNTGSTTVNGIPMGTYACATDSYGYTYEQDYRPTVTLNSDKSCTVYVNMGAGMATGKGTWSTEELDTGEIGVHIVITTKAWADSYSYSFVYYENALYMTDGDIGITPADSEFKLIKTASGDFKQAVAAVSETWEDKLAELTSGGKAVSTAAVMSGMYEAAKALADSGTIKNLSYGEQGVFFTYADGTPGGVVMDLPDLDSAASKTLSFTPDAPYEGPGALTLAPAAGGSVSGLATAALANTAAPDPTVIGSNKVLLSVNLDAVRGNDFENYEALKDKFKANTRGLAVTVKDLTVADYKTLNTYGAVFISNPTSWTNDGVTCIELAEDYDASKNYDADRQAGRIGVYSKISPGATKYIAENDGYILSDNSFDYELRYVLFPEKFFSYYYGSAGAFPNSFIHLGFDSSISMSKLSNLLIGAGAGCVTGYTDAMQRQTDFKVIGTLMDTFLKADKNTMYDAYLAVLDKKLGTDSFTYTYYKNFKWDIASREVESMFDMRLKNNNGELKLWGAAAPKPVSGTGLILSGTYYVKETDWGSQGHTFKVTCTNNTGKTVTGICFDWVGSTVAPKYREYGTLITKDNNDQRISLAPGDSFTFEGTYVLSKEQDCFSAFITDYYTGDLTDADYTNNARVEIPVSDYKLYPLTKVPAPADPAE
jgi:hypothetical protein